MIFFNKIYKYIFRKKIKKEFDDLLAEKTKIEAEIARIKKQSIADKLKELDSTP